jgi:two-component system, OmpR family, phosphate regulon sensor histidine kinase PhoR
MDGWSIMPGFVVGLGLGLAAWYGAARQWDKFLQRTLGLYPIEGGTQSLTPRVRLLKAVEYQQQQEQSLRGRLKITQNSLYRAPLGYLEVDADGHLDWLNLKAITLLGLEQRSPPYASQRLLMQVVRSYELDQLILKTRTIQRPQQLDWTFHLPSPHNPALTKDFPIRGLAVPSTMGRVGVFLEDRSEAERLLAERDRWTSDVAHELKTPLTSIRLIAETLQGSVDDASKPWLDRLIAETMRLSHLVQDILELSHLAFPTAQAFKFETINLPKLIQQAWITLEPLTHSKNLSLFYKGPEEHWIRGDSSRLLRAIMNVVDNSIKFSPPNAPIYICLHPEVAPPGSSPSQSTTSWMGLDLYDTGIGFPEDSLNHVFERFYKADPSRGRQSTSLKLAPSFSPEVALPGGGSGLGLAIVQQIITAHDGIVEAHNHPETGGAWIRIFLPNLTP